MNGVADVVRDELRIVMASSSEPGARSEYITALESLVGQEATQKILERETVSFAGRLGIQHRDVPYAIAFRAADVGVIYAHLAQYYSAAYPQIFTNARISGSEQFSSTIAIVSATGPLRVQAARAFSEYVIGVASDVYPRYGFAPLDAKEFGEEIVLG